MCITGLTDTTLAEFEKKFLERSLLMVFVKWESMILAEIFTGFIGILFEPVASYYSNP